MNRTTLAYRIATLTVVAAILCGWLQVAAAADDKGPPANIPDPGPELVEFYKMKNADPQRVRQALETIFFNTTARYDVGPTNDVLMVVAREKEQQRVKEMIGRLDIHAQATQIKVGVLKNADPEAAAKVLATLLPKDAKVAVNARSRSVIIAGSPDQQELAETMLMKLDEGTRTEHQKAPAAYNVRVIWLASGTTREDKGVPSGDDSKEVLAELSMQGLRAVILELTRLHIYDPRLIGQMVVRGTTEGDFASFGGKFFVKSSPTFDGQLTKFSASGHLSEQPDGTLVMNISIESLEKTNDLDTQIVVPLNQYVLLATMPTGNRHFGLCSSSDPCGGRAE